MWLRLGQPHPRHQGEIIVATSLYSICEKKNSNINMNVTKFISSSKLAPIKILTLLQGGQPGHAHCQGGHGGGKGGQGWGWWEAGGGVAPTTGALLRRNGFLKSLLYNSSSTTQHRDPSLHLKVEVQWKITDFGCEKTYFRRCVWVFT